MTGSLVVEEKIIQLDQTDWSAVEPHAAAGVVAGEIKSLLHCLVIRTVGGVEQNLDFRLGMALMALAHSLRPPPLQQ